MSVEIQDSPENPSWKNHWLRETKYSETHLRLADNQLLSVDLKRAHPNHFRRYEVGIGPIKCSNPRNCPYSSEPHFELMWCGDNLEQAHGVFETCSDILIKNEP